MSTQSSPTPRVAFQGASGAFSEEAIRAFFGPTPVETIACREFGDIGRAVLAGTAELGILPVENSIAGSVQAAYDVLARRELAILAEVILPIRHCLLGLPGATVDGLRRIISHPVALAQCTRYLARLTWADSVASYDTAGAAREVAERRDDTVAAVAGRAAADRYGLALLAQDIQDRDDNQTRFFIVGAATREAPTLPAAGASVKTALLFETEHRPGALVGVLGVFSDAGINLVRIESRPAEQPWHYRFFLEIAADAADPPVATAIRQARQQARQLTILGSFPTARPATIGPVS